MTEETWPGEAHFRAQLAVQREFPGWTVSHYPHGATRDGIEIPAGHYCAVYWHLSEAPVVAPDLDALATAIRIRNDKMDTERRWADRSALSAFEPQWFQ
jgi:hypothetical protein